MAAAQCHQDVGRLAHLADGLCEGRAGGGADDLDALIASGELKACWPEAAWTVAGRHGRVP
jgi:hypothetical protein